jgi:hypothetical protein
MKIWALAAACAALAPSVTMAQTKESAAVPQKQEGRFVIVHSPFARADTMLIDTATGRTWELVKYTNLQDEPRVWIPVRQENTEADAIATVKAHPPKPDQGK